MRISDWSSDVCSSDLIVWMAVTYATVIVFEVVKLWQASEKPIRHAFLGIKK